MSSHRAALFGDEQPGSLALNVHGDEHRPRLGRGLHARGDIRRVPEHLAGRVDDHGPGLEPDARGELRRAFARVLGVDLRERALDRQRRPHRALGVILLRRG